MNSEHVGAPASAPPLELFIEGALIKQIQAKQHFTKLVAHARGREVILEAVELLGDLPMVDAQMSILSLGNDRFSLLHLSQSGSKMTHGDEEDD